MSNDFEINSNEYLQQCDLKDVVCFDSEKWLSIKKLKQIVRQSIDKHALNEIIASISNDSDLKNSHLWFYEGEECEILRAGSKGWQKGKIKINVTLEFVPDEPEEDRSPLDDIRQADNNSNS